MFNIPEAGNKTKLKVTLRYVTAIFRIRASLFYVMVIFNYIRENFTDQ